MIVTLVWLLIIAALTIPQYVPYNHIFIGIGAFLVIAHIIEIMVFKKRLKAFSDYVGVFLFGALHLRKLAIDYQDSKR